MKAFDFAGRTKLPRGPRVGKPCSILLTIESVDHTAPRLDYGSQLAPQHTSFLQNLPPEKFSLHCNSFNSFLITVYTCTGLCFIIVNLPNSLWFR